MHLLDLGRPLPAVVVEVEAEPADPVGGATAERILDAVLAVIAAGLHNGESILISRMWLSHRNTPCAEYPLPICVLGNPLEHQPVDREQRLRGPGFPSMAHGAVSCCTTSWPAGQSPIVGNEQSCPSAETGTVDAARM